MKAVLIAVICFTLVACPRPRLDPPPPTGDWAWKLATDPGDVMDFLNGSGAYRYPVADARINALWKVNHIEFYVFYRRATPGEVPGSWAWKKSFDPSDVNNFLNGVDPYPNAVMDAQITAIWRDNRPEFYIFYQSGTDDGSAGSWGWKLATDLPDTIDFLNGTGAYQHPVTTARIAELTADEHERYYIFFQRTMDGDPIPNWSWKLATDPTDAMNFINGIDPYGDPVAGYEVAATWKENHARHHVFHGKS